MPSRRRKHTTFRSSYTKHVGSRAAPGSFERLQYLERLVTEAKETDLVDYKEQVVANLANFAYDPRNYSQLHQLHVADLFFNCVREAAAIWSVLATGSAIESIPVEEHTIRLVELALGGLSNLVASSSTARAHIFGSPELAYVVACLAAPHPNIVVHALTILIHLFTPSADSNKNLTQTHHHLNVRFPAAVRAARAYQQAYVHVDNTNSVRLYPPIGLLSTILLEDCCRSSVHPG
ncbi:Armadillo repeat-containing protein 7 [Fasciolopsis buskii]|uniref:Armadillo repeat-containing protein 7 n=1 Tax=Fasciolopsis buskii TaxID=27845 RepID=A0A8E0VMY4_9TREM|nr:Armadillo repeat-containing protein 7 [Fasciolopsis buski]